MNAADAITEVGLSRSMCYGSCPVYSVTLHRSGEASFEGEHFVDLLGAHIARIDPVSFGALAEAAIKLNFQSFARHYAVGHTDAPTTTTWIVSGGTRREVED